MRYSIAVIVGTLLALWCRPCFAYVEAAYTMGRLINESTNVVVLEVAKVDREKNIIIYKKVADLKGKHPTEVVRHVIGQGGFHPREWQGIMAETEIGRKAIFFHNGSASETCINNYWYQCYPGGEVWNLVHAEPYLLRSYAGKPERLIPLVQAMLAGQEVVVPCMADGDKNALTLRSGRMQRMRASLKLMDYNAARDFVGWGEQLFQRIDGMAGFAFLGTIERVDPGVQGIAAADFDLNGHMGLCLFGESKVALLRPAGNTMEDVMLPYTGGARAAAWGDCNGDNRPDLLLGTTSGPKLFINSGGKFADASGHLPREGYYNLTSLALADVDADGKQDIVLANGLLGLRVYRCRLAGPPSTQPAAANEPWFEDVSSKLGVGTSGAGSTMKTDQLAVADVNGDGRVDLLCISPAGSILLLNTPQGFIESKDSGLSIACGRGGAAFGDYNADKAPDLFIAAESGCKLFRNDGKGHFADVTAQSGAVAQPIAHASCAVWADLDKNGKPDLLVGCIKGPNRYFRNNGDGTFADAGLERGFYQRVFNTRSLCVFDMNKDGTPDLALNNEGQDSIVLLGGSAQ